MTDRGLLKTVVADAVTALAIDVSWYFSKRLANRSTKLKVIKSSVNSPVFVCGIKLGTTRFEDIALPTELFHFRECFNGRAMAWSMRLQHENVLVRSVRYRTSTDYRRMKQPPLLHFVHGFNSGLFRIAGRVSPIGGNYLKLVSEANTSSPADGGLIQK
ncbi:hypothetical protein EVAR_21710_1 [Eumeta japonica]|uniref:Uncharacterized protein n=1 Tax=Eumeta variegata TaxID=151549 RepID=A0A4C1W8T1_EUMVA|nr:hypothetical protein EVAR_21710_1 [Eumeta japonica]